jgi:hypothetical protein
MPDFQPIPLAIQQNTTVYLALPYGTKKGDEYGYKLILSNGSASVTKTSGAGQFTLTAAETLGMSVGRWAFFFYAINGDESLLLQKGYFDVEQDPTVTNPDFDPRSDSKKMLDSYNALLTNAAYIKTLDPATLAELEAFRKQLVWDVKREEDAEKLKRSITPRGNKLYARFV